MRLVEKFKSEDSEIIPTEVKAEALQQEQVLTVSTPQESNPQEPSSQESPSKETAPQQEVDYRSKYQVKIEEAMKNRFWTTGLDFTPYVVKNPPFSTGASEDSNLVIIKECKIAHLLQAIDGDLVLNVTISDNTGNKKLRIAQTFD